MTWTAEKSRAAISVLVARAGPFGISIPVAVALALLIKAMNPRGPGEGVATFAPAITAFVTACACEIFGEKPREYLWLKSAVAGALPWLLWLAGAIVLA